MESFGILWQEFAYTDCRSLAMRFDFVGGKDLAVGIASLGTQGSRLERNVPIDDGSGVVLRLQFTHYTPIQEETSLWCIRVAHHAHIHLAGIERRLVCSILLSAHETAETGEVR